jgi:hypothetical protein
MTIESFGFRRLVLGLQPGAPDRAAELAVEFASLFDLELLGLFIDDLGVRHLAAMPAARAISTFGAGWRRLDPNHAPRAVDYAAESVAERRFADIARRLARRRFEAVRGGAAQAVAAISRAEDSLVIVPPAVAADRAAEPFASLLEAAFGSAAAVMLAPSRLARATGAVVAIAASPNDPSLEAARAIAQAAGEPLVVIDIRALAGDALRVERKRQEGEAIGRIDEGPVDYAAEAAHHALKGLAERLTVVSRGAIRNEVALRIALARGAPVLSLGPRGER